MGVAAVMQQVAERRRCETGVNQIDVREVRSDNADGNE